MKLRKSLDSIAFGGKTYREIFIDNQLIDLNNTSITAGRVSVTLIGDNQIDFVVNVGNNDLFRFLGIPFTINDVFYFNTETKSNASPTIRLQFNATLTNTFASGSTIDFTNYSDIKTAPVTSTFFRTGNSSYSVGDTFSFRNMSLYNLTQLFGAGNEPTKAQMDTLFAEFQEAGSVAVGQFEQAVLTDRFLSVHNPASNDIPIPALNNKTLNEVFVGGNLLTNGDFSTGDFTGWSRIGSSALTVVNNEVVHQPVNLQSFIFRDINVSSTFYFTGQLEVKSITSGNSVSFPYIANFGTFSNVVVTRFFSPSPKQYRSIIFTRTSGVRLVIGADNPSTFDTRYDNIKLIDLVSLGIASQTQAQLDNYYQAWQRNNAGTLLANTFIQHDQNSVPIADLNGKTLDEVFIGLTYTYGMSISGVSASADVVDFWYSVWQQNHKLGMRVHRASGNDIPLAVLNNQSLNQVFVGGNLIPQTLSGYDTIGNAVDQGGFWNVDIGAGFIGTSQTRSISQNHVIYANLTTKFDNATREAQLRLRDSSNNNGLIFTLNIVSTYNQQSFLGTNTLNTTRIEWVRGGSGIGIFNVLDNQQHFINLTSLGIATLTKSQLDYLYQVWQFNTLNALVARQFIQEA